MIEEGERRKELPEELKKLVREVGLEVSHQTILVCQEPRRR